jgi:hypothetical protein
MRLKIGTKCYIHTHKNGNKMLHTYIHTKIEQNGFSFGIQTTIRCYVLMPTSNMSTAQSECDDFQNGEHDYIHSTLCRTWLHMFDILSHMITYVWHYVAHDYIRSTFCCTWSHMLDIMLHMITYIRHYVAHDYIHLTLCRTWLHTFDIMSHMITYAWQYVAHDHICLTLCRTWSHTYVRHYVAHVHIRSTLCRIFR